jgi:hypothetical protein
MLLKLSPDAKSDEKFELSAWNVAQGYINVFILFLNEHLKHGNNETSSSYPTNVTYVEKTKFPKIKLQ